VGEGDEVARDIVLTVPGEPDFVTLVRIAARIVAGRAGRDADARSRLQAEAGAAFFALAEGSSAGTTVVTRLLVDDGAVQIELAVELDDPALAVKRLEAEGVAYELAADGRSLRARVSA
jgi:hypothetical protein